MFEYLLAANAATLARREEEIQLEKKKNLFVFIWNNCLTKKRAADQSNCTH